jgi:flagellar basal-body rod protein FlgB
MFLSDRTLFLLERSMDARLVRQNRLAGDVANADTPGYHPQDSGFDQALGEALSAHPESGLSVAPPLPEPEPAVVPDHDGNTVDLDRTMSELATNGLGYAAAARMASKKLATLRQVITDGNA